MSQYPNIVGREVVQRLFLAATDENIDTLSDLLREAGILWQCPNCGDDNCESDTECQFCDGKTQV